MIEHFFPCPFCGETISVLLDPSVGHQKYIEDCEICCNPLELDVTFEAGELIGFEAQIA